MKIAGQPITRSEFEYSYNKNNSEGVIDKKSVTDYVDLFINYKLKVQAALDERMILSLHTKKSSDSIETSRFDLPSSPTTM